MLEMQKKNNRRRKSLPRDTGRPDLYVVDKVENEKNVHHRIKKRTMPRYLKVFLYIFGIYLLFTFALGGFQIWQLKNQMKALEKEQELLLQNQEELNFEIQLLNNPEIIERIARESLGMVKPGETKIIPAIPEDNIPKPKNVPVEDMGD